MSNNNSKKLLSTKASNIKRLRHLLYAVVLIILDQVTKYVSRVAFSDGSDFPVIPGVLRFVLHKNTGAVWGFLSGTKHSVLYLTIATLIILALIVFIYFKIPDNKKFATSSLISIFVG